MTNKVEHLTGLYNNTDTFFNKAIELLRFKADYSEFYESEPVDYKTALSEYQAGLEILEELIQEDHFIDKSSLMLVYNAVSRYRYYLGEHYPMTVRLVTNYLNEVFEYGQQRFDS